MCSGAISYQTIQQLEAGGGTKHLVAIARALGVSAEWLQDGSGPAPTGKTAPSRAALAEKLKVLGMANVVPMAVAVERRVPSTRWTPASCSPASRRLMPSLACSRSTGAALLPGRTVPSIPANR